MRRKMARCVVRPQGRPMSEINVTPLVDVVLVLLIIFIVVTPLLDRLRRVLAARPPGDRLVFFDAHDQARHQRLVAALDGARQAGAEILTMTTEPMTPAAQAGGAPG